MNTTTLQGQDFAGDNRDTRFQLNHPDEAVAAFLDCMEFGPCRDLGRSGYEKVGGLAFVMNSQINGGSSRISKRWQGTRILNHNFSENSFARAIEQEQDTVPQDPSKLQAGPCLNLLATAIVTTLAERPLPQKSMFRPSQFPA